MPLEPYYSDGTCTIYHGDVLDVLADIEPLVDAVVTDPPYASGTRLEAHKSSSGAMLRAGRFADRPIELDQMTSTGFVWLLRAVASRCRHPSPKPPALMARLIPVVTPVGGVVLDPFMGAGATLRGAVDCGRRAIGIEVDERYCEVAARRLGQGALNLNGSR